MTYAKPINNEIVEYNRTLPFSTETTSFGVGTTAETLKEFGYLPVVGNEPEYDRTLQKIGNVSYKIGENEITKFYEIVDLTNEEIIDSVSTNFQNTIQNHIAEFVKSKGYDNENSIAKYLVEGNPFYIECKALSLWIGNVWLFANNLQNEVIGGVRAMPETNEELVGLLPVYVG